MTFLEIAQRTRTEAGLGGSGPSTVVGQVGELGRVVGWVQAAYTDIQDKNGDWQFLRGDFSFNTASGGSGNYLSSLVTNFAEWEKKSFRCYLVSTGAVDEKWLKFRPWDSFRDLYIMGANRTVVGRPIEFTIKPDQSIQLWPIPDNIYNINGEFYRRAYSFAADVDVPVFPRFHMAIVYNAVMKYAAWANNPTTFAYGEREYNRLLAKLENTQRTEIVLGGTMT
jgi:hypothetical protein